MGLHGRWGSNFFEVLNPPLPLPQGGDNFSERFIEKKIKIAPLHHINKAPRLRKMAE
jgi:hypothetical protein